MKDPGAYELSAKEKNLFILLQLFFIAILIQYNDVLTGIIAGALLLYCIFYNSFSEKWQLLKRRRYITGMLVFFFWIAISIAISHNKHESLLFLDRRLPLLYFPLTIGLVQISASLKQKILLGFAVIISLYCLACLVYGISNYIKTGNVDFLYNDALTVLTGQQSIYISLLVNFAIYIYAWFIFFKGHPYKMVMVPVILFLFGMSYLLASRNMMVVLYLSVALFIGYYIVKRKKYLEGAALIIILLMGGFLVYKFFPKTINRFSDLLYLKFEYSRDAPESHYTAQTTPDQWNGTNFRMAAWQCGWELFKQHPIVGTGLGDKRIKLFEKYKEKNFHLALRRKKNLHNNYLDILVGTGMIGFLLFITGWLILPLRFLFLKKDYLSIWLIMTFAIAMITEVYFDRSFGGMLFGFFVPFLLTDTGDKKDYSLSFK